MIHKCEICGYKTVVTTHLTDHLKSQTHKDKVEIKKLQLAKDNTIVKLKDIMDNYNIKYKRKMKKYVYIQQIIEYLEHVKEKETKDTKDKDTKEDNQLKFIDLFCGIGGFHQVLKNLGGKCILSSDSDKSCQEVYKINYNMNCKKNVCDIKPNEIEDFDILCAGFPCQPFSNGGKKKTFNDSRGLLFDEIMRIAKIKKPKFMFLENVKHILKVGNQEVIKYIKEQIDKYGYKLQLFKISPHEYGIPQQRERIYFVCVRKDIYNGKDIVLPISNKEIVFEDYLDKKKDINKKYFINNEDDNEEDNRNDIFKCLNAWDEMIKIFEVGEKISPTILVNEFYKEYTEEEFNDLAKWRQDYIIKNKPLYKKYKKQFDEWYKKHKTLLQKREIYAKLEWQVGIIKENDSIFNYFIQFRQSGIRVKKAEYFPTLVAISQIPIYGKEKRYITPRECARLQSFPESFILPDDKSAYKQFGNAINIDNATLVIKSTLKHYGMLNDDSEDDSEDDSDDDDSDNDECILTDVEDDDSENECILTHDEKCLLKYNGCDYQAYQAWFQMKRLRNIWSKFNRERKVYESHILYDRIFRLTNKDVCYKTEFITEEIYNLPKKPRGGYANYTNDHPFSARLAFRTLMNDWPTFMDDFDDFKVEFKKLTYTLGMLPKQNQDVKIKKDGNGELIVEEIINERYKNFTFINMNTNAKVKGFPLDVPDWYLEGEKKRLF